MIPERLQAPPRPAALSQSFWGTPPEASTLRRLVGVKNPIDRLSGDQKGWLASSVPGNDTAERLSSRRTQRSGLPSGGEATKAIEAPSGERANCDAACSPGGVKIDFSGGRMEKR